MIYLDNAATTQIAPEVLEEMMPYLTYNFGNAGSLHSLGRDSKKAIDTARERVAKMINAKPEQIIFTSSGSEANNLAIHGTREYVSDKKTILTSPIEHDSIMNSVIKYPTLFLGVDKNGVVNPDEVAKLLSTDNTIGLVDVMYVNNEIGSINDIRKIGEICKCNGVLFHTDCVQAAGFHPIDVESIHCDMLSLSAHKIHAPKGVGALYVRDKSVLTSIINGGTEQEFGIRGGTENVAGIVGFGKACEIASCGAVNVHKFAFYVELKRLLEDKGLHGIMSCNGNSLRSRGKVLNVRFDGVDAETLILMLDAAGVCVSAGSACRSLESEPSRVLTSIGLTPEEARQSIRISFSTMNNHEEISEAAKIIAEQVYLLKSGEIKFD